MTLTRAAVRKLERRLTSTVDGVVAVDQGTRALYASDASNYRVVPPAVVIPRSIDGVLAAVATCREFSLPVVVRGGGTSVSGQATGNGVVIDTSRYLRRIAAIEPDRRQAVVEPGVILDDLRTEAAQYGLTFGPDPSTHDRCTIGGMIGNNACGPRSVAWGTTADHVEELEVLLYDGTVLTVGAGGVVRPGPGVPRRQAERIAQSIARLMQDRLRLVRRAFPPMPRRGSGYRLDWLLPERNRHVARALVGSEGTCVTVLGATLSLVPLPLARVLLVLAYDDLFAAADEAPAMLTYDPLTVEGVDDRLIGAALARGRRAATLLPPGRGFLYVEFGGDSVAEAEDRARRATRLMSARSYEIVTDPGRQRDLWRIREEGVGLATRMPDGAEAWPGWEDAAVPPDRLGAYLRAFHGLLNAHKLRATTYGHFGEGCVHARIDFDMLTPGGRAGFRRFVEEAAELAIEHGGVYSGEHGDGQARAELYQRLFGSKIVDLFAAFKGIWDPDDAMNPGMLVRPYRLDEHLRFGDTQPTGTVLALTDDGHDLARAVRRCVGIGACRSESGGVMCPSYRATLDERHSTRGRARLLEEMMRGDVVTEGWRSRDVHEALDLCLGCKGCATDCPSTVDMATYKAEFLYHHYKRRLRPRAHYSLGWLPSWLPLAARMPRLTNAFLGNAVTGRLAKLIGGLAPERDLPLLATPSLMRWYRRWQRHFEDAAGDPVLLWPDTFTSYFTPGVGQDAMAVLADAGFAVRLPQRRVCCGLTWLSTGQLRRARRAVRSALEVIGEELAAGVPVVVLEPSCAAALRADVPKLLPDDDRARALAQSVRTLSELLVERAPAWRPPAIGPGQSALVQRHCHQYAVLGFDADRRLLRQAGLEIEILDEGCCGLAGDFGFTRGHYDVSMACGELGVLPRVREAHASTAILADGFSCRLQIEHGTDRQPLHLAELLASGLEQRLPAG